MRSSEFGSSSSSKEFLAVSSFHASIIEKQVYYEWIRVQPLFVRIVNGYMEEFARKTQKVLNSSLDQ
jgi:hypothetical protein